MPSDTPNVIRDILTQEDYRRLYYSEPEAALKVPAALQAGYGICRMGQALAKNGSTIGGKNKLFPYDPSTIDGTQEDHPRLYVVAEPAANVYAYVTIPDSYKIEVGDDVYVIDANTAERSLGAVAAIDRTTYSHMAKITTTIALTTDYTIAQFAYLVIKGYSTAVAVLENSKDTGEGKNAKGANGAVILGNCVLYAGRLTNVDAAAITDLSAVAWGNFLYIR